MQIYNQKYLNIAEDILRYGRQKEGRNGYTRSLPFKELEFDMRNHYFPLLTSRKIHYEGVLGEYAAIIRQPKNVKDFQKWGCNYWNEFGDPDTGELRLSYGNSWYNFNGVNQVRNVASAPTINPPAGGTQLAGVDITNPANAFSLGLNPSDIAIAQRTRGTA